MVCFNTFILLSGLILCGLLEKSSCDTASNRSTEECAALCPPGFLADKVCDSACNNEACVYDHADCGTLTTLFFSSFWVCLVTRLQAPCCGTQSCSLTSLGDGVCQPECYNAQCNWDSGDCST